jgi:3-hydroxymyristoyl/3-hydroxydecanoyl-(acyl carrier protein) dehydratase
VSGFVIPPDHPCLAGHFPGRPIVPGVVLLDKVAAVLGVVPGGFGNVRFSRPVRPGDRVEVAGEGGRFVARVDGEVVVQGQFVRR